MTRPAGGAQWPRVDVAVGGGGGGTGGYLPPTIVAPPNAAVLTPINVVAVPNGMTAATEESGAVLYVETPTSQGFNQAYVKSMAGARAKLTLGFFPHQSNGQNSWMGITFRNSSSGLQVVYGLGSVNNIFGWYASRNNAAGVWTSDIINSNTTAHYNKGDIQFFRLEDDGTNRVWSWSQDLGRHWRVLHSVARTDHAIFDQVGVGIFSSGQSWRHAMTIIHWDES